MRPRRWFLVAVVFAGIAYFVWTGLLHSPATTAQEAESTTAEQPAKATPDDLEYYELYKALADTLDQVERNYVQEISRRELMEAAIHGILERLDPYSNYIDDDEVGRFRTAVDSQFGGIGIQVDMTPDGRLVVISPIVGSPAYRAGVQAGDWIVEIEGASTEGLLIDEAIARLKGDAGTNVSMTILRPTTGERQTLALTREVVKLDTVLGDRRDNSDHWDFMYDREQNIGYVRVSGFGRETASELRRALVQLEAQDMQGLVLDLRFNPGGQLSSAIDVSDLFISEGRIVSTSGRNSPERVWEAEGPGTFEGFPMAVLVNRFSASASEIVAACLQDHDRAFIVGERTWGKGSVQNVIELREGRSALKLTTASYQRPNGANIHRFPDSKESDPWGVMPDDVLMLRDGELVALMNDRHRRDLLLVSHALVADSEPAVASEPADEAPADEVAAVPDMQLNRAMEYVRARIAEENADSDAPPDGNQPAGDQPAGDQPDGTAPAADERSTDPAAGDEPAGN